MMIINNVKVKDLGPINTIVEVNTFEWYDRKYGNTYCSATCYINRDTKPFIVAPMGNDTSRNLFHNIIRELIKMEVITEDDYYNPKDSQVFIRHSSSEVTKARCEYVGNPINYR